MKFLASAAVLLSAGVNAQSMDYSEQFEKIALAVTSFQTCESLGYSVDRQGISNWIKSAKASAIATGLEEGEANAALEASVDFKWQRVLNRHSRALVMQHSSEHVWRNNRHWKSRCEKLANDPLISRYFSQPQT